jgi:hypothetical protein
MSKLKRKLINVSQKQRDQIGPISDRWAFVFFGYFLGKMLE